MGCRERTLDFSYKTLMHESMKKNGYEVRSDLHEEDNRIYCVACRSIESRLNPLFHHLGGSDQLS